MTIGPNGFPILATASNSNGSFVRVFHRIVSNAFDSVILHHHNASVALGRAARRFVTGLAGLGVLSLAVLPPEHVHLTRTHDGHHAPVVHRHYTAHQRDASVTASIGDHDGQPLWLDEPFTASTRAVTPVPPVQATLNQDRPAIGVLARLDAVGFASVSVHDPPLRTSSGLRAPPASI